MICYDKVEILHTKLSITIQRLFSPFQESVQEKKKNSVKSQVGENNLSFESM